MKKVFDALEKILMVLCGTLTVVMVASIFYQVILRYIFHSANSWAEEVARYSMMWITMLISPVGFRRHRHIRVDFVVNKMSLKAQSILAIIIDLLMCVFLFLLGKAGFDMMMNCIAYGQKTPALKIPMGIMYSSVAIGATLMIFFILECIWNDGVKPLHDNWQSDKSNGEAER